METLQISHDVCSPIKQQKREKLKNLNVTKFVVSVARTTSAPALHIILAFLILQKKKIRNKFGNITSPWSKYLVWLWCERTKRKLNERCEKLGPVQRPCHVAHFSGLPNSE